MITEPTTVATDKPAYRRVEGRINPLATGRNEHPLCNVVARCLPAAAGGLRQIEQGRSREGATRCQCLVLAKLLDYFLFDARGEEEPKQLQLLLT